jgi:hypothetical protein
MGGREGMIVGGRVGGRVFHLFLILKLSRVSGAA